MWVPLHPQPTKPHDYHLLDWSNCVTRYFSPGTKCGASISTCFGVSSFFSITREPSSIGASQFSKEDRSGIYFYITQSILVPKSSVHSKKNGGGNLRAQSAYRDSPSKSGSTIPHCILSASSLRYALFPIDGCAVMDSPDARSA